MRSLEQVLGGVPMCLSLMRAELGTCSSSYLIRNRGQHGLSELKSGNGIYGLE